MDNLSSWLRLQLTPGLGRVGLTRLIEHYHTPENAIEAAPRGWPKKPGLSPDKARAVPPEADPRVTRAIACLDKMNVWSTSFWDETYPDILRPLPDPPALLYICGELPQDCPMLGVVGTRHPTHVGRTFTEQLAEQLAHSGVATVSGLARGIDTAAHRGTLAGGGKTIAVLGCGIDRVYPSENKELFRQITQQGAVVSEYPPGTAPLPGHFPGRNRIISGLSNAVLVVEAARKSGSLITAEFALDQGKEIMAVPGGVDHKTSYGTNLLIKEGAHPITEASEVLQILGHDPTLASSRKSNQQGAERLTQPAHDVLEMLDLTPRHCDELAGQSGLTPIELSAILLHLELQGLAEKLPGGRYIRVTQHFEFP